MGDESSPTIEVIAERGRRYQPGERVAGELRLVAPEGTNPTPIDLRIERVLAGKPKVLKQLHDVATLRAGERLESFSIQFPIGAFNHPSQRLPVETFLVAEARGRPNTSCRWRLFNTDRAVAQTNAPKFRDFRSDNGKVEIPPVVYLIVICLLGAAGYLFSTSTGLVAGAIVVGLIAVVLIWALADDDSTTATRNHLDSLALNLSPSLDGSSLLATAEVRTGEEPVIESIDFSWWGREETRSTGALGSWSGFEFESKRENVATNPDLGPNSHYEFASSFELPVPATPSFTTESDRVQWGVDVIVSLSGSFSETLSTNFAVSLLSVEIDEQESHTVVASEIVAPVDSADNTQTAESDLAAEVVTNERLSSD